MALAFFSSAQQRRRRRWPDRYAAAIRGQEDLYARCPLVRQTVDEAPGLLSDLDSALIRRAPLCSFLVLRRGRWKRQPRPGPGKYELILDAGELVANGFVMQLSAYRWDALGCVEALLRLLGSTLASLCASGSMAAMVSAEPIDYLVNFFRAFEVDVRLLGSTSRPVIIATAKEAITTQQIESVVRREVAEERSHGRYASILRAALAGERPLRLLDVGGGDGHMAEWWSDMGCDVHLLEVDADCAVAATARLGQERVALHDGVSAWPYPESSFDVCLLLFVLHHIGEEKALEHTLAEAARVSRRASWEV
ncbi:unnamed protein product [Symbiodinium sp. CCMP2592]|nr:unnamed protein product [Symbiodinium sp. CCMP2592]